MFLTFLFLVAGLGIGFSIWTVWHSINIHKGQKAQAEQEALEAVIEEADEVEKQVWLEDRIKFYRKLSGQIPAPSDIVKAVTMCIKKFDGEKFAEEYNVNLRSCGIIGLTPISFDEFETLEGVKPITKPI